MQGQKQKCAECNKEHHEEYDRFFCSKKCQDKWDTRYDWQQDHSRESNKGAICPFCEHEHKASGDYPSLYEENTTEFDCENCHKTFEVEPHCEWTWYSRPLDSDYPEEE